MLFSLRILTLLVSLAVAAQSLAAELKGAASESQAAAAGPAQDRLFHKPGLIYFWALNDACEDAKIDRFVDAFVKGQAAAVCLHPRPGLLKPYGGQAWFDFVKRTVDRCAERGLDVWLYDEDPYPSGACGGLITMERPECQAMEIKRFEPAVAPERNGLYCFPPGTLLWCGLVDEKTGRTEDVTPQVGVVRRKWTKLDPWDSRYYYPATPLYSCPRAWTEAPEYAVELKQVPEGRKLLAFVAQPVASDAWPFEPDRLNPDVTRMFIQRTHDRYAAVLGDRFGKQVKAIFTDEAKYNGAFPWTREMFSDFKRQFGYDLPPQLWRLFAPTSDPQTMLTRLHYRQWCGDRFRSAWLEPVSRWCREHKLALVGHISPEDDPVQQTQCISNLFPCHTSFDVPGLDLIIPAVGDQRHPLINLGVLSATSAAQQLDKPGVMSESLACSGLEFTAAEAGRILRWQLLMGVTTPVIHCAYNSTEGLRLTEAPPDFGPESSRWEGMVALGRELAEFQSVVRDAQQIAPVAVLWPIRSFATMPPTDFTADSPLRTELVQLIRLCLDRQVGIHLLDEADLWRASIADRELRLCKARYTHVVIPPCLVLHERTVAKLREAFRAGVAVVRVKETAVWQQTDKGLEALHLDWCQPDELVRLVERLPRLVELKPDVADLRCTAWERDGRRTRLLMNLGRKPVEVTCEGERLPLAPGRICLLPSRSP